MVLQTRAVLPDTPLGKVVKHVILRGILRSHRTVRLAFLPLALYQNLGIRRVAHRLGLIRLLPKRIRELEAALPPIPMTPLIDTLPEVVPPSTLTSAPARIGLFLGCVMSAMFADVSRATVRVLSTLGCEVVIPKTQHCCGAPHIDQGDQKRGISLAQANITAFENARVDVVVADCAACSAMLKEYEVLLQNHPTFADRAAGFSRKVLDINEFLAQRIPNQARLREVRKLVTYHSPCHLAHAQGICVHPRTVLKAIPGLSLVEMKEAEWCCGSAGAYMLTHPERSSQLLDRKMRNVNDTGAEVVATSNPGCILQLAVGVRRNQISAEVRHVVELVDKALSDPSQEACGK
ncbi:MAG: (Fe-S)-binding protein [Armatimonadota bacterium]